MESLGTCLKRGDPTSNVGIKTSAGNKHSMCQASQKIAEKGGRFRGMGKQHLSKYLTATVYFYGLRANLNLT